MDKLIKLAYYGYLEFFEEFEKSGIKLNYDDVLPDEGHIEIAILNGCCINPDFCVEYYKRGYEIMGIKMPSILISNNILVPIDDIDTKIWFNFKYPTVETCYKILELYKNESKYVARGIFNNYEESISSQVACVAIIRNDIDLFRKCNLKFCSNTNYKIAHQVGNKLFLDELDKIYEKTGIIKSIYMSYKNDKNYKKEECYFKNVSRFHDEMNINILEDERKTEFCSFYADWITDYDNTLYPLKDKYEYSNYKNNIKVRDYQENEFTNYNLINNTDIAINLGIINNLTLSKIIMTSPRDNLDLFKKYNPFLIYTKKIFLEGCISEYIKIQPLVIYNIAYINIICGSLIYLQYLEKIKPEINLYIIAKKMNNNKISDKFLDMYKKHGKFYKIMDLEKQCYIDPPEEIYDIPEVKPLNLFKGDELNPYYN